MSDYQRCPRCFPEDPGARVRDNCREHSKTPMQREYPTIFAWVQHQGVSTDALVAELRRALQTLDSGSR